MKLLIYGSKDFGQVVREVAIDCQYECCGFIDDEAAPDGQILGTFDQVRATFRLKHTRSLLRLVIAIFALLDGM